MPWQGEPQPNGDPPAEGFKEVIGKLFPVVGAEPFVIAIEGSNDLYFMLFSDEEKLKATTEYFLKKLGMEVPYGHGRVTSEEFIDAMIEMKIRIMCDPHVVDDHHTKWTELARQGDLGKYFKERN